MKILLVHNTYQQRGGEDVAFDQERQLLERTGHQVATYCRSNREAQEYSLTKRPALAKGIIWNTHSRQQVLRLLVRERPQLAHIHNTFMMVSPSVYSACQEARVPVVQTLHNYRLFCPAANFFREGKVCEECVEYNTWRGIRYGCYRGSRAATAAVALMLEVHRRRRTWTQAVNCYVALTEFARQKFIAAGLPEGKLVVKPNFVHGDPGERSTNGDYALFVGRLSPEKGLETLLAAWERLHNRVPLLIIGDGPLRARLEAEVSERRLSSVSCRGPLARHEAWAAVKEARFLVLPSQCYEQFPMSIAEAFACGVPVLCSRLGAMQEIVADNRTGIHFTPADPEDLAQKVEWAWTHTNRMREMGKEARKEYETRYTAEKNYPILMEIYQRAVAEGIH